MVKVNTSDSNPDGGQWLSVECDAIFSISDMRVFAEDSKPRVEVDVIVEAATDATQIRKKMEKVYFPLDQVPNKITNFACAIGIYNRDQWRRDKEAGIDADLPFGPECINLMFAAPVRHQKWDEKKDTPYWEGVIRDNKAIAAKGGDDAEDANKKIERAEKYLKDKRGRLQIGGESGFTFWSASDPDADHIPIPPETLAIIPPEGLPTRDTGALRFPGAGKQGGGGAPPSGGGGGHKPSPPAPPPSTPPASSSAASAFI